MENGNISGWVTLLPNGNLLVPYGEKRDDAFVDGFHEVMSGSNEYVMWLEWETRYFGNWLQKRLEQ